MHVQLHIGVRGPRWAGAFSVRRKWQTPSSPTSRNRRYGILAEVHARALMDRVDQHVDDLTQCAGLAIGIGGEWHGDVISTARDPRNALAARGEDPSFLLATQRSVVCGI